MMSASASTPMMIHAVALVPVDEELTCSYTTFFETSCWLSSAIGRQGSNVDAMAGGTVRPPGIRPLALGRVTECPCAGQDDVIAAAAEIDVAPASAGDPLGRKPPAEAGATSIPMIA